MPNVPQRQAPLFSVPDLVKRAPRAKHVLAVGGGKGGVGKSTVSLNLALALAEDGSRIGLLDADFHGPDIPLMVGLTRKAPLRVWSLSRTPELGATTLEPVDRFGIKIMSVGFLLADQQHLYSWGPLLEYVAYQMLFQVNWGELDFLVIDLPPGAAEAQQQLLRQLHLAGAVIVVGPQDVTHLDSKRMVRLLREIDVPVLGGVENMSSALCPECGKEFSLFPKVRHARTIWAMGVEELGRIPIYQEVAAGGDRGEPVVVATPHSPQAAAFRRIADQVVARLGDPGETRPTNQEEVR
jgi:ATP-binding protein involved in chromosome partitioning